MTPQVGDVWVCQDALLQTGVFHVVHWHGRDEIYIAGSEMPWDDWDEVLKHFPTRQTLIWRMGRRY